MTPVINLYREKFGINISYSIHLYSSYPETENCLNESYTDLLCDCFVLCEEELSNGTIKYHHKNQDIMFARVPNGNPATHLNMFLTGHRTCNDEDTGECQFSDDYQGRSGMMEYKIGVFTTNDLSSTNRPTNLLVISHEIGHFFDAPDHYGDFTNIGGMVDECLWGNEPLAENFKICDYCAVQIHQHHNEFNHE